MKHLHKFASVLLALVMALSLMVPAFASGEETVTLTIDNEVEGHTYSAFQILTGVLGQDNTAEEDTMSNVKWGNGIKSSDYQKLANELGVVLSGDSPDYSSDEAAQKVAEAMAAYGKEDKEKTGEKLADILAQYLTDNTSYTAQYNKQAKNYTISNMTPGYYLIKNTGNLPDDDGTGSMTAATDIILQVLHNETVTPKAANTPTVEKKIKEGDELKDATQVAIGDTVTFQLKAWLPANITTYKKYQLSFVDTLSNGLTYGSITSVKVCKDLTTLSTTNPIAESSYTVTAPEAGTAGGTLTVAFDDVLVAPVSATGGEYIVVEYTATLNKNAQVGTTTGNLNDVLLKYTNDPNWDGTGEPPVGETPKDTVIVFTFELDNSKFDDTTKNPLENVEFALGRDAVEGETGDDDGKVWATATFDTELNKWIISNENGAWKSDVTQATAIKSNSEGKFDIKGLAAGTYYLRETKALDGYNILTSDIKIVITAELKQTWDLPIEAKDAFTKFEATINGESVKLNDADGNPTQENDTSGIVNDPIANRKGATLPETGGTGTTIFYIVGGLLTVGAVVLLVTKKRMSVDSDK